MYVMKDIRSMNQIWMEDNVFRPPCNLKEKTIYVQDGTVFVDFPPPAFSPGRRIK